MIGRARGACAIYQAVLMDFADHRERTEATVAALDHLERCRRCEDEMAGIVRMIVGLRRLADSVAKVEPDAETWPRLRDRVTRRDPAPSRWQPLGGLMATAVVALLVIPSIGGGPVRPLMDVGTPASATLVDDRHYESPPGALTAEMVNAIAGQDVSKQARLRSVTFRIAPSSVDRDEPNRMSTALAGSSDGAAMPVVIARS